METTQPKSFERKISGLVCGKVTDIYIMFVTLYASRIEDEEIITLKREAISTSIANGSI